MRGVNAGRMRQRGGRERAAHGEAGVAGDAGATGRVRYGSGAVYARPGAVGHTNRTPGAQHVADWGQRHYTPDLTRPGMLMAKVLRPPAFGAALTSLDISAAAALPDVVVVREGDFVGVAAPDLPTATHALDALRAEWNVPPQISARD